MNNKKTTNCDYESFEGQSPNAEEIDGVDNAIKKVVRRRGASKPCGVFARSDWFWIWSKGADLLDAVYYELHPEETNEAITENDIDPFKIAKARLNAEVSEICEATSWNISEYRKTFSITIAELAKSIGVSESTLRKKLSDGALTLKEFLTLCAVCLTDPCVMLGFVDSEDVNLVHNVHNLGKASDHRAVGEFVQILFHKQGGRTMIRKSVSPMIEADLGWRRNDGDNDLLPEWPLWWQTEFDYTLFNELVNEYLHSVKLETTSEITYETKASAASELAIKMRDNPALRIKFDQVKRIRSTISGLIADGYKEQAESLHTVESEIINELLSMLQYKTSELMEKDDEGAPRAQVSSD